MTPVGWAFNLHCTTEKIDVIVIDVNLSWDNLLPLLF